MSNTLKEVSLEEKIAFFEICISPYLFEQERETWKEKIIDILDKWSGRESAAGAILAYAAQQHQLMDYYRKLDEHFDKNLCYVAPERRRDSRIIFVENSKVFVEKCFKDLGIIKS